MAAKVTLPSGIPRLPAEDDGRLVVFFDLDNCVYSKHSGIAEMMKVKIQEYFKDLGLPDEEAQALHHEYYTSYGLAVRGLVEHHSVSAIEYDVKCDQSLPLADVLSPNPALRDMLMSLDRKKVKVWALTNAYYKHAVRVLDLVGISDCFEGVISCDYGAPKFTCKPEGAFFHDALVAGGQLDPSKNYFVDDSALNIKGAHSLKWGHCVLFDELGDEAEKLGGLEKMDDGLGKVSVVGSMMDLRSVWKELFIPTNGKLHPK